MNLSECREVSLSEEDFMEANFKCPVCGRPLLLDGKTYKCENNHCFDVAKQGYVNLLQSQKSSKKRHGDDTLMVKARQDFLEKGYYQNLADKLCETVLNFTRSEDSVTLADLGCGECWYTAQIYENLTANGKSPAVFGIDISKQALIAGSKRCKALKLAVASTSDIPLPDKSCDIVVNAFAPFSNDEVCRVLKDDGFFVKVIPLEFHLFELKKAIYEDAYENEVDYSGLEEFQICRIDRLQDIIELNSNEDIMNLFKMTPYYYKTSKKDQEKLEKISYLKTETEFAIIVMHK